MKDLLEVLRLLFSTMSAVGILVSSRKVRDSLHMAWRDERIKDLDPLLFEKYRKETGNCRKKARNTLITTIILLFLTFFIWAVLLITV